MTSSFAFRSLFIFTSSFSGFDSFLWEKEDYLIILEKLKESLRWWLIWEGELVKNGEVELN